MLRASSASCRYDRPRPVRVDGDRTRATKRRIVDGDATWTRKASHIPPPPKGELVFVFVLLPNMVLPELLAPKMLEPVFALEPKPGAMGIRDDSSGVVRGVEAVAQEEGAH